MTPGGLFAHLRVQRDEARAEVAELRAALEHIIEACEHSSPTIHAYSYIAHSARRALDSDGRA